MDGYSEQIRKRLESGEIREQKCWQFIRELNSFSEEQLDQVALVDGKREYTYRQLFAKWEDYARVFSALGICRKEGSRAAVLGTPCSETIFAFFGLNMTGASVSIISLEFSEIEKVTARENITDLILNDYEIDAARLRKILKEKDDMGLRNVIVMHVPVCGDFAFAWEEFGSRANHRRLKAVKGAVFMEDLLKKYKDHEIIPDEDGCDEASVILHTSGTTRGIPKPVPLADRALNESVRRHMLSGKTRPSKDRFSSILYMEMSSGFSFMGMFSAFGNGGKLIAMPTVGMGYRIFFAVLHYRVTNIVAGPVLFDTLMAIPFDFDLSSVETVMLVGTFTSADAKKRYKKYLEKCGCSAKLLTGYGLVEAAVGCTLSDPDSENESVGYLLPDVKAKLRDEDAGCFHDLDGKAHTGVLYLSTPSLSCGKLDGEVLFELDEIDGEKYLNTHDLFTAAEDGELSCIGRANKFFVNNEGVRFDAGLVERAVSAQKGIGSCGLAPGYDKLLHDTIPVLYVTLSGNARGGRRTLKEALEKAYIDEGLIEKTSLPSKCVITDDIPRTMTGKVDVHSITEGNVSGDTYKTEGVFEAGKLVRIELTPVYDGICGMGCDMLSFMEDEGGNKRMPVRLTDGISERLESGEITDQKMWKFVKELNSYSDERLEAIALTDCSRDYTYRQLFRLWDRYAGAFSALGISRENHSRVAMRGTCAVEAISAFFALNMTGTSVSMVSFDDFNDAESWKRIIKTEGVTDIMLTDIDAFPDFVSELAKEKESLGIRNIIILNVAVRPGEQFSHDFVHAHNRKRAELRKTCGLLFMEDLIKEYRSHPVSFCSEDNDDAAVILHTSGTVSGIHKPVPHSDAGMNEAVARIVRDDRFKSLMGRAVTCSGMDMSASYSFIDQVLLILAFGGRLHVFPAEKPGLRQMTALIDNGANLVFFAGMTFEMLDKIPVRLDFSSFEHIIVGGSYVSADAKKRYDRLLRRNGAKSTIMIGYGVSEAGAACILAPPGRKDDAIGYPLSGVRVKIYDESDGKYYDIEDGPRTGVLHIASKSVSCGHIDDKVFFELEDIDGEKYLNTYDLVRVCEDGALYYAGRMNKYYVNNEGVRFDAGLVETAVSAEPGIDACGLAPEYKKVLHDSVPVLYVQTAGSKRDSIRIARDALVNVFVRDDVIKESNLPSMCVITDSIPLNDMGKVDTYRISRGEAKGKRFSVLPVRKDGALISVELAPLNDETGPEFGFGVPEELEDAVFKTKGFLGDM